MSLRELVVLGTASQVPTRQRNHNGYLLRWDEHGFLFDPGEGTQRQFIHADVPMSAVTRIFITHFHGDHSLGLASVVQRLSLDGVEHPVEIFFPETGLVYYERLVQATIYYQAAKLVPRPLPVDGAVVELGGGLTVEAHRLDHPVDTLGYRIREADRPRFLPERLAELGLSGPLVGELAQRGEVVLGDRRVTVDEVTVVRPGAVFGFVMDTRMTATCRSIADAADLLVCESTYLEADAALAAQNSHMTARQAAELARDAGVRRLLLTHFSQRYREVQPFLDEARSVFPAAEVAHDLGRYPFPRPLAPETHPGG